jgi:undecaprenyl-phosphate 4-deoxy-4-formamido-L-arabinose transferase
MRHASVSVVVPVCNSEGSLAELTARLRAVLSRRQAPFEIILVNDGSRDASWGAV